MGDLHAFRDRPHSNEFQRATATYCFESAAFQASHFQGLKLCRNHRQAAGEVKLIKMLLDIQNGDLNGEGLMLLNEARDHVLPGEDDFENAPITLCCGKKTASLENCARLERLPAGADSGANPIKVFGAVDRVTDRITESRSFHVCIPPSGPGQVPMNQRDSDPVIYKDNGKPSSSFDVIIAPALLKLRVGARGMSIASLGNGVVNGTMGKVVGFYAQPPDLDLPYGVTSTMANTYWQDMSRDQLWPLVQFSVAGSREEIICRPRLFTQQTNDGVEICARMQIPLLLAYAFTVHKAQGLTLPSVIFKISGMFAFGQLLTGCSRVRRFQDLKVVGNLSAKGLVSPKVVKFDRTFPWVLVNNI